MSYLFSLAQKFGKRPTWLYRITYGADTYYLTRTAAGFTTAAGKPDAGFAGAQAWAASAIANGKFMQSAKMERAGMELKLPASDPIAQMFLADAGPLLSTITIWHGYANDPDAEYRVKFRGRVMEVKPALDVVTLRCESNATLARSKGLQAVMQRPCRHSVYFGACGADLATQQVDASASAMTGRTVTVAAAASQPNGYYAGSPIEYDGAFGSVLRHEGDQLLLINTFPALAAEIAAAGFAAVKIARGCNQSLARCEALDAVEDFGGFPWMSNSSFDGRRLP